jgi:hypothetical protein
MKTVLRRSPGGTTRGTSGLTWWVTRKTGRSGNIRLMSTCCSGDIARWASKAVFLAGTTGRSCQSLTTMLPRRFSAARASGGLSSIAVRLTITTSSRTEPISDE